MIVVEVIERFSPFIHNEVIVMKTRNVKLDVLEATSNNEILKKKIKTKYTRKFYVYK